MDTALIPAIELEEDLQKTIQVLFMRFDNPKAKIVDLCEEVGISRQQYYRKMAESQEIIDTLRNLINQTKRLELARIATSRHEILDKTIDTAMSADTVDELVKAMRYLDEHEDKLLDDLGARPGIEDDAQQFLRRGPKVTKQQSRFASIQIKEDADGTVHMDLMKEHNVLELEAEDIEDQSE